MQQQLDILAAEALPCALPDARGPPIGFLAAPSARYVETPESFKFGASPGHGGARVGAGRPRKAETPPPEPPADCMRWYIVLAKYGRTEIAESEIRDAGFEVVTARRCHPATPAMRSASGSLIRARDEYFTPLLVRYLIVSFNLAERSWLQILAMDHSVERIISGQVDGRPTMPIAVPDVEIALLRTVLSPDGVWYPPGYKPPAWRGEEIEAGTPLWLPTGPLADHPAVADVSDGQWIEMVMSMFNRDNVKVTTRRSAVETI
jgi:hypothetical protein